MDERNAGGYSVAYSRDDTQFPVYAMALLAAAFLAAAFVTGRSLWAGVAIAAAAVAYYNVPLLETGRPTLGANQYGIFVQGLGLIGWRAIKGIHLMRLPERAAPVHELHVALNLPLGSALVSDWRKRPWHRSLMRLPWSLAGPRVVRLNLEPFDRPPMEIHEALLRMWRYYRS